MTRSEALAQWNTEPLMNGRCVGKLECDPDNGTVLHVIYCECPGGTHDWESTAYDFEDEPVPTPCCADFDVRFSPNGSPIETHSFDCQTLPAF